MPEFKSRVIDDVEYTIELMTFSNGIPLLTQLQNILVPIFASRAEYDLGHTDTWISEAVASYLVAFGGVDLVVVSRKLLYNTEISFDVGGGSGGGRLVFESKDRNDKFLMDNYFAGKYKTLFKVLAFAVEANYPDFFSEAFSQLKVLKQAFQEEKALKEQELESMSSLPEND